MPFLPVIVRRVFWVLGVLAALPLLLLGASSVYERFAPCTTGANDNKASMAALLGVLDMVRPGPDDAKRWAATHPKSVRRSLEEELEDEIYGDGWDDEEYADEGAFEEDEEGYAESDRYHYEEDAEDEGYADANLVAEDAFEDEEPYDEAYADQDELSEDGYEDFEDDESLEESETDEEYLDDEYLEDEATEEDFASAQRVHMPAVATTGSVDEYGLETPAAVRRGASVLESLQVLPETCEIVYENLIPRNEAIDRIEGVAEQVDEVYEEESSEALARVKSVAGSVGTRNALARITICRRSTRQAKQLRLLRLTTSTRKTTTRTTSARRRIPRTRNSTAVLTRNISTTRATKTISRTISTKSTSRTRRTMTTSAKTSISMRRNSTTRNSWTKAPTR